MAKWNLSDADANARAAAFEAKMLTELVPAKPKPAPAPAPIIPNADGIQIFLTANGQTTRYENLSTVPLPLRQQIMNAWRPTMPPPIRTETPAAPTPRPRSRRTAVSLNLLVPGLGQFYFCQPGWGCAYAFSFIACFVALIVVFLRGYSHYMDSSSGGDILDAGNLEKLTDSFHVGTLGVLQAIALLIYIASTVHLFRSKPRL